MEAQKQERIAQNTKDAPSANEVPFKRIPNETLYNIFARLDAESLGSVKSVCKEWNLLLDPQSLKTFITHRNFSTTSSFLVRVAHLAAEKFRRHFLTVDAKGRCQSLQMLNSSYNLSTRHIWSLCCNGVLVYFPRCKEAAQGQHTVRHEIVMCHPSLRWVKQVALDRTVSSSPVEYHSHAIFRGAFFDPLTLHFTLLLGFEGLRVDTTFHEIHTYTSVCKEWRTIVQKMPSEDSFQIEKSANGVFSQGCFFWIDTSPSHTQLVIFNLAEKRLHTMPLPQCPFGDIRISQCDIHLRAGPRHGWKVKECGRKLVLVHQYIDAQSTSAAEIKAFSYYLEESEGKREWKQVLDLPKLSLPKTECVFDCHKSGGWLWAHTNQTKCIKDQRYLRMVGDVQLQIPLSDVFAPLGIPPDAYGYVDKIWVLEENNLWDILALS